MIGDNLSCFDIFFQALNIDLNQKHQNSLTVYTMRKHSENNVAHMYL
ncbi:hypothetical protein HMPREF0208_00103 [Citrobacter koseri]|nr:hypothetical protein HMPREF3220_00925 [Citrobacter koseri]KXA05742.1 hypothetical protein HMPREF3207_00656 [Citrobacter koseri]KXB47459.1 hypothetical protein HMPREF0208_00103 [Citrobacter koseri]